MMQKATRWFRSQRLLFGSLVGLSSLFLNSTAEAQNEKRLIRVRVNGRETALMEKVVVVSGKATLSRTPNDAGEPIEPWAIFFRIKNDDGSITAVNGRLRVADSNGNPVGYIGERDLKSWSTRFILDPIEPNQTSKRVFVVNLEGGVRAEQNVAPEGKRRFALITNPPAAEKGDDTEYPVVVYAGNVQGVDQRGTLSKQRNELRDVKLEIMFVIESSDFMFLKLNKAEGKSLLDYVKQSIRELITDIRKDEDVRKAVRLGFSEYKDSVPKASFTSRLTCDLTDNFELFSSSLDKMEASKLEDDNPDDVIAGLNEAAKNATWTANSVKHIVLLGRTSCQLSARGQNPPDAGRQTVMESVLPFPRGFNSTGLSINQLIARARPQGGGDSRARTTKTFHAFRFDKDIWLDIGENDAERKKIRDAVVEVTRELDKLSAAELKQAIAMDPDVAKLVAIVFGLEANAHQSKLALAQYQEIAQNNRETDGIFQAVEPGSDSVKRAVGVLSAKVRETFNVLEKVRDGEGLPMQNNNEIAQPLFTLVGAAAEKFKDQPVLAGTATVRDKRGREVAFKKVMVSEKELRHMRSTLDALYTKFKGKTAKADRQDVGGILDTMKEVIAETSAGQEVTANAKLKDLISDLPLKTAALDTSAADLALMTAESFKGWLERLEAAVFRIDDLLQSRQDWLTLSERAVNEKFTFLRLSELP